MAEKGDFGQWQEWRVLCGRGSWGVGGGGGAGGMIS